MPQYIARPVNNHFGYIPGNWVIPHDYGGGINGAAIALLTLRMVPFIMNETCVIDQVAVKITTVGTTNIQLGIYNASPFNLYPLSLLDFTANIVSTALGPVAGALNRRRRLDSGLYWSGIQANDATVACLLPAATGLGGFETIVGDPSLLNLVLTASNANVSSMIQTTLPAYGTWADLNGAAFAIPVGGIAGALPFLDISSV